jgi:hypothetical protein
MIVEINDDKISDSQVETIKEALEYFYSDLQQHGLGEDEHGLEMTRLYCKSINKIKEAFIWPIQSKMIKNNHTNMEANIVINGASMNLPESMTLKIALESFASYLSAEPENVNSINISNMRSSLYKHVRKPHQVNL